LAKVQQLFGSDVRRLRRKRGFTSYSKGFDEAEPPVDWPPAPNRNPGQAKYARPKATGASIFPVKKWIDFRDNVDPHGDSRIASGEGSRG
jgi:hypothetical protein